MSRSPSLDCLVLNRNRKHLTEGLIAELEGIESVQSCFAIDSGSEEEEVATQTIVRDDSPQVRANGLRPNRGFNLGLKAWLDNGLAEWVLLLPNDSEISEFRFSEVTSVLSAFPKVAAIYPLPKTSPYSKMLGRSNVGLGWNFSEGPIILNRNFVKQFALGEHVAVFDNSNFRGYCSFLDLALRIYSDDKCIIMTDSVSFSENKGHTISHFQLMKTEPYGKNIELMVSEGKSWLKSKYGWSDRRNLELMVRLLFEEFIRVNPDYKSLLVNPGGHDDN